MHKKTYLHIPHQIFECRSTNTIRIYHSLAQLESNTTFFTIPGHKERAFSPHRQISAYKQSARVCVEKNLKKITLTRAHRCNSTKKITDTKKVYRKLQYQLLHTHHCTRSHYDTSQGSPYMCALVQRVLTRAKLSVHVWVCSQMHESKTSAGQHAMCKD